MAKMRKVILATVGVVLIVTFIVPAIVDAGSLKIWPDQLKPTSPAFSYVQPGFLVSNGTFYAPVALPSGSRVVKLSYYHRGTSAQASTALSIVRMQMGNASELMGSQSSTDATGTVIPVDVSITGDPIIKKGYRYYVVVSADNTSSNVQGVKIVYE